MAIVRRNIRMVELFKYADLLGGPVAFCVDGEQVKRLQNNRRIRSVEVQDDSHNAKPTFRAWPNKSFPGRRCIIRNSR
jgi:hypothetical protein